MSIWERVPDFVREKWEMSQDYALTCYNAAMQALSGLETIGRQLTLIQRTISIDTTPITESIGDLEPPDIDMEDLRFDYPNEPQEPPLIRTEMDAFPEFPNIVTDPITEPPREYISDLLAALQRKLLDDVQSGSVGIPPEIERAIFNREYERSLLAHQDAMDRIASEWSKRGLPLPDGVLQASLMEAEINFTNKRLDVSRDIAIKSFELALQNTQFIIQQSIAVEQLLVQWANWVADRALATAKAVMDGQIEVYKARVMGVSEQYRGIIEKAKAQIEHNNGLIKMYLGRIEAYSAKIRAETARIDGTVRGYEGKINVFRSLAAFEADKIGLDIKVLEAKINQAIANANILIKDKELEMKNYEVLNSLKMEAMKSGAAIAAQLAAGALSSVSAGASMGISSSVSRSSSESRSESRSTIITVED